MTERVVEVVKPTDGELEALYNRATCLLFPSKFEGFGWPAVEAQVCGCPVLCSDAGSLGEVVGDSAFVRPVGDEEGVCRGSCCGVATDEDGAGALDGVGSEERGAVRGRGRWWPRTGTGEFTDGVWGGEGEDPRIQEPRFKEDASIQGSRRRRSQGDENVA